MAYIKSKLVDKVIGASIEVDKDLDPGLLESTYERCLAHEFKLTGLSFECQLELPVIYKSEKLDCEYRIDMMVVSELVLELKSSDKISKKHAAQILTDMKLMELNRGLIINFNVELLKHGVKSFIR